MARKNAKIADSTAENLGAVFESRNKSVMAQDNPQGSIREKVAAVREVVMGRNKHEIALVLQHFDNDVECTIQAFLDNGARDVLEEWQSTAVSSKPVNKKKKKNKVKEKVSLADDCDTAAPPGAGEQQRTSKFSEEQSKPESALTEAQDRIQAILQNPDSTDGTPHKTTLTDSVDLPVSNGNSDSEAYHLQPKVPLSLNLTSVEKLPNKHSSTNSGKSTNQATESTDQQVSTNIRNKPKAQSLPNHSEQTPVSENMAPSNRSSQKNKSRPHNLDVVRNARERTTSEASTSSLGGDKRKPYAGLEKSLKDLQRQTVSLQRQQHILQEEMDRSRKQISQVFAQLINQLNDREASLLFQMTKVKNEAQDLLVKRQKQATELKTRLDKAPSMRDHEIQELRADIKHFVSERKIDVDLGGTKRFVCDLDHMLQEVENFGQVMGVKAPYSVRRPSLSSSVTSSIVSHDDLLSPLSPWTPHSQPPSITTTPKTPAPPVDVPETNAIASKSISVVPAVPVVSAAKVISQSESVTQYEVTGLVHRKPNTTYKDHKPTGRGPRLGSSPRRGQGQRGQSQDQKGQGHLREDDRKEEGSEDRKSRSARRRQKQRERIREQKRTQDADSKEGEDPKQEGNTGATAEGHPQGQTAKNNRQRQNWRTPSPKKRTQGSGDDAMSNEGQKVTDEGQRGDEGDVPKVQGRGNEQKTKQENTRQRRPRSKSQRSRSQSQGQRQSRSQGQNRRPDSSDAAAQKTVTVSVVEENVNKIKDSGDIKQTIDEKPQLPTENELSTKEQTSDSKAVEQTDGTPELARKTNIEKDINENNATYSSDKTMTNGAIDTNNRITKTATVSIVPQKEVSKATVSMEKFNLEENALPQRKERTRRRGPTDLVEDVDSRAANGVCNDADQHPIMNGSINGEVNGHDRE